MTNVYGRLTGKAGVCLSALGFGTTNLVTRQVTSAPEGLSLIAVTLDHAENRKLARRMGEIEVTI